MISTEIDMLMDDFDDFLEVGRNNQWLVGDFMEVYVRKSTRIVFEKRVDCFDIANVIVDPDMQNQGAFTMFLTRMLESFGDQFDFFAENVYNDAAKHVLTKFGFIKCENGFLENHDNVWNMFRPAKELGKEVTQ